MKKKDLKIALVHDFLNQYGGAEKTLEVLCEMFPQAPIYTILYEKEKMRGKFENREIHASFFQKLPKFLRQHFKYFMFLLPTAPETFDLRDFDLVISSSGAWTKGIVTKLNTIHIAYIHSPMRFVWDWNEKYLEEERKKKLGFLIRPILSYFRVWDKLAADRPDYLIANSRYTQRRIEKYYRRESAVIYPPVYVQPATAVSSKLSVVGYFLIVSRLSAYKKIKTAIEVFNKLELPLFIVGEGKEKKYLKSIARGNIKFLGWQSEAELAKIYSRARAFIFPGVDDFGLAPAEAMLCGVPVIALRKGGLIEIVEEGKTGEFFEAGTPEVLANAIRKFVENEKKYDKEYIKQSARKFSKDRFKREINEFIGKVARN